MGTMFVWAPVPEPYKEMGSLEFAKYLVTEAHVATSPGVGFGRGGEGFVRFALDRKRAAHRPGRPQHAAGADQARLARDWVYTWARALMCHRQTLASPLISVPISKPSVHAGHLG